MASRVVLRYIIKRHCLLEFTEASVKLQYNLRVLESGSNTSIGWGKPMM